MIPSTLLATRCVCSLVLTLALSALPLEAQSQGVLREVWSQLRGTAVSDLEASPSYPESPVFAEVLPHFAGPVNSGNYYGSRLRAVLTVPETASYIFWISGDDRCELRLSPSEDPLEARTVAQVRGWTGPEEWTKYEDQRSEPIPLTAGQRVYVEALQKEHGGGDSVSVGWSVDPEALPVVIDGAFLTPVEAPEGEWEEGVIRVEAGTDQVLYAPAMTTTLHGQAILPGVDERYLQAEWGQLVGGAVSFADSQAFVTEVSFPGPGTYVLQLQVSHSRDASIATAMDMVRIVVHERLDPEAGTATQAFWFGVDGSSLHGLLDHPNFPWAPAALRQVTELAGPVNYASRYGTLTQGYLLPPVDGEYDFFIVGDERARWSLSTDASEERLQRLSEHHAGEPDPVPARVTLQAGQRYRFQMLHVERWGGDSHRVFWRRPGEEAFRVVSGEFLAPIPVTEQDDDVAPFQADAGYLVSAGPDRVIYQPEREALLAGHVEKRSSKAVLVSSLWRQVSGPGNAEVVTSDESSARVRLDQLGIYEFELEVTTETESLRDRVVVEVKPALSGELGQITREVWVNRHYASLDDLRADPDFPEAPDIVDNLPSFEGPVNWGSKYGTRVTGYLQVPRSGSYTFFLSADDRAEAFVSTDASPANLESVCLVDQWTRYQTFDSALSQRSAPRYLEAGQRYFVELHHVETWGGDHFTLGWSFEGSNDIQLVSGSFLQPSDPEAAPFDAQTRYYGNAGSDRRYYWPHDTVVLEGRVMRFFGDDTGYTVSWTQTQGASAWIENGSTLSPTLTVPQPGRYEFEMAIHDGGATHTDRVEVWIEEALVPEAGHLLRSVWLNLSGGNLNDLMEADPQLGSPTFEDLQPGVEPPVNWTDYYATRLSGFLHVPEGGPYRFWMASDDQGELWLSPSTDPNLKRRVAWVSSAVRFRDWDRRSGQESELVDLAAGVYYIEALHKEHQGGDHLSIAWDGPATNGPEVLSRGFLSPWRDAPLQNREIQVVLGADRSLLWPNQELDLAGLVFDLHEGPNPLAYEWVQTAGAHQAVFSDPFYPITGVTFPAPGIYVIDLKATDGVNEGSDTLVVNVRDPLAPMTGGVLREAWVGVSGWRLDDMRNDPRFPGEPSFSDVLPSFDAPVQWGDDYGQRLSATLSVPETGDYQFFIASDDQSDLFLNTSGSDPAGAVRIAYADRATGRYRWDRRAGQASEAIPLEAGQSYYLEALHKEGGGGDYLSVAWRRAGSDASPHVIAGAYLSAAGQAAHYDGELTLELGADREAHWPTFEIDLHAVAIDEIPGPKPLGYQWGVQSVPPGVNVGEVFFRNLQSAETVVEFPAPGDYQIQLQITDGLHQKRDSVKVTIQPPIAASSGSILAEIFEDIDGSWVTHLTGSERYPDQPDRRIPLAAFELPQNMGERYGTVIRGFLHPPVSGIYRFNLSSDDWSEVYLSPSEDPEAMELACFVPAATRPYEWEKFPHYQVSRPIELEAGQRYYIEARHKERSSRDHLSLAWHVPGEEAYRVIAGAYLSPWQFQDTAGPVVSLAGPEEMTLTVGTPFKDPGFTAIDDTDGDVGAQVTREGEVDSSKPGLYQVRYIATDSFGNVSRVTRQVRVVVNDPSPAWYPPDASGNHAPSSWRSPAQLSEAEAARFLMQGSFGPSEESVAEMQQLGIPAWLDTQFGMAPSLHREHLDRMTRFRAASDTLVDGMMSMEAMSLMDMPVEEMPRLYYRDRLQTWWTLSVNAPDQLRQLVAYALSNIFVISDKSPLLQKYPRGVTHYYDILVRHAFGNYRDLLQEVTLSPMMGLYLTTLRSGKESPDENYAREVLQLFSIGLDHLNTDGTFKRDGQGQTIPTYGQNEILELARSFTGWTFAGSDDFFWTGYRKLDVIHPMMPFEEHHDHGSKTLLGGQVISAGLTAYQDMEAALDNIFHHPNVGPFIARRLIQKLVKSNPSPSYIFRVASAFNDNGSGVRGDLKAVVRAILTDEEARRTPTGATEDSKLREPILRVVHFLRAMHRPTSSNPPTLGQVAFGDTSGEFGQAPLHAPSVFNFFEPNFQLPGVLMDAGLYTPEFQITTEVTTVDTANFFFTGVLRGFDPSSSVFSRPSLDKSALLERTDSPESLLRYVETYLVGRALSGETRAALASLFEVYVDDTNGLVDAVLQIVATLPEFVIQN